MASASVMSVITVTHRRRALLLEKAASIAAQTLAADAFEWVVVANGDADGSADALRTWSEAHGALRVRVLCTARNGPVGAARNRAVDAAEGDVLYLSDDDCLLAPDTLATHLRCQERARGVWLGPIRFRADGHEELWLPRASWWSLNGANASIPAGAFAAAGGFEDGLEGYGGEDLLLGYRLRRAGVPTRVCDAAEVTHVGPNPVRGANLDKARQAGANAVRIVARHPELAARLGVHPWLMAVKRMAYGAPWSSWLERVFGGRFAYERAYFRGAVERRESRLP